MTTHSEFEMQPGNDFKMDTVQANGLSFSFIEMGGRSAYPRSPRFS